MTGYAALLGGLGGVAIGFGLLIALISAFQPVFDPSWIWANLVVGVVLLGAALASGFDGLRERMRSGEARRVSTYGTSALVGTAAGIAILAMLAFFSTRYTHRFDWTEQGEHTLTSQSLSVLEALEEDVKAIAFFSEIEAPQVRDLLERYAYESERFQLDFADPNARPDLVEALAVDEAKLAGGLVRLSYGAESVDVDEFTEEKVTNALVSLTRSGDRRIYFLVGHNEREIEGERGAGKEGFQLAAEALRNENYQVETLLVAQVGDVPEDADAVVIAGATQPLPPEEIEALVRYRSRGGAILVMLDPRANTNLHEHVATWGVEVGDDIIVDLELAFFRQYMSPFAGVYAGDHPITQKMGERRDPTLFHLARSVGVVEGAEGDYASIVSTGDKSWAERDLVRLVQGGEFQFDEGQDAMGPVSVVVAGEGAMASGEDGSGETSRLVVVGDSDFASNEFVSRYGGNRDLFVNSVNWLLGDVEAISVRPHQSRASRFTGAEDEVRAIQFLSLFVLPEAIAVLGVLAWWSRRKAPGR